MRTTRLRPSANPLPTLALTERNARFFSGDGRKQMFSQSAMLRRSDSVTGSGQRHATIEPMLARFVRNSRMAQRSSIASRADRTTSRTRRGRATAEARLHRMQFAVACRSRAIRLREQSRSRSTGLVGASFQRSVPNRSDEAGQFGEANLCDCVVVYHTLKQQAPQRPRRS